MNRYDRERLLRFINSAIAGESPDHEASEAAADALLDMMAGVDVRKELGLNRTRGKRGPIDNPDRVNIDDPRFRIVLRYVAGTITYDDAIREYKKLTPTVGRRTIETYIAAIKPRAESTHAAIEWLRRNSIPTEK